MGLLRTFELFGINQTSGPGNTHRSETLKRLKKWHKKAKLLLYAQVYDCNTKMYKLTATCWHLHNIHHAKVFDSAKWKQEPNLNQ